MADPDAGGNGRAHHYDPCLSCRTPDLARRAYDLADTALSDANAGRAEVLRKLDDLGARVGGVSASQTDIFRILGDLCDKMSRMGEAFRRVADELGIEVDE